MIELLIIADDFTGALDAACPFGVRGIPTMVFCDSHFSEAPRHIQVAAINTDTRHSSREQAYHTLTSLAQICRPRKTVRIFKKMDSALRGNWSVELQALLDAGLSDRLYVIPAYPASGRTTENGTQLLYGREISQSAYGSDPFEPVRTSRLADYFPTPTIAVPQSAPLRDAAGIHLVDAGSNAQLEHRCAEILNFGTSRLLAGSAGLASALAETIRPGFHPSGFTPEHTPYLLVVSGSLHPVSRWQTAYAMQFGYPCITCPSDASPEKIAQQVLSTFRASHVVTLQTSPVKQPLSPGQASRQLAEIVCKVYDSGIPAALAVFGGDTLLQIAQLLFHGGLCPIDELEPGVPVSIAHDRTGHRLWIISKSGGFGSPKIIPHMIDYILA